MSRQITIKASIEATETLGLKYFFAGTSAEEALADLKTKNYMVGDKQYNATRVASIVGALTRVNNGIQKGVIKVSKKGGLKWS